IDGNTTLTQPALAVLPSGAVAFDWSYFNQSLPAALNNEDVQQRLLSAPVLSNVLSAAVEIAVGDGADDTFLAAPGALNAGDSIDGGGGFNQLQLTAGGVADFTGVQLSHLQEIVGAAAGDTLIFPIGTPSDLLEMDSGQGSDSLQLGAGVDL